MTKLYDEALAPIGLGANQYSILARRSLVGQIAIQDLARQLIMDRSTLGLLVHPLGQRGFVKLEASEQDRRSRMAALTQAGKAAAKARPRWAAAQRPFESTFGQEDALELRTSSKRLRRRNSVRARPQIMESTFDRVRYGFTTICPYYILW